MDELQLELEVEEPDGLPHVVTSSVSLVDFIPETLKLIHEPPVTTVTSPQSTIPELTFGGLSRAEKVTMCLRGHGKMLKRLKRQAWRDILDHVRLRGFTSRSLNVVTRRVRLRHCQQWVLSQKNKWPITTLPPSPSGSPSSTPASSPTKRPQFEMSLELVTSPAPTKIIHHHPVANPQSTAPKITPLTTKIPPQQLSSPRPFGEGSLGRNVAFIKMEVFEEDITIYPTQFESITINSTAEESSGIVSGVGNPLPTSSTLQGPSPTKKANGTTTSVPPLHPSRQRSSSIGKKRKKAITETSNQSFSDPLIDQNGTSTPAQILQIPLVRRSVNNFVKPKSLLARSKSGDKGSGEGPPQSVPHQPQKIFNKDLKEKLQTEASVVSRVNELQKDGMWYDKRLPKSSVPPRNKTHWDYLLEEMVWLATDFASERRWKLAASGRISKIIERHFHSQDSAHRRLEREKMVHLRRISSFIAKEIRNFWSNAKKLIECKEAARIEDLRKRALDQHLSFIVDQTEKYSTALAESFVPTIPRTDEEIEDEPKDIKPYAVLVDKSKTLGDDEEDYKEESVSEEDDEETIEAEESQGGSKGGVKMEVKLLEKESLMPYDKFIETIPKAYLEEISKAGPTPGSSTQVDADYKMELDSSGDELDTIEAEEKAEAEEGVDHAAELKDLRDEGEMDIEELRRKYSQVVSPIPEDSESEEVEEDEKESTTQEGGGGPSPEESETDFDEEVDEEPAVDSEEKGTSLGLADLLQTFDPDRAGEEHDDDPNDVSAMAASFQPKGYTLSSTEVSTPVPFLIKHTLREYQHIGLDWLVTMYNKKLNGILADEMGLGKTIQTIALIAHLAVELGIWGPHLIVVPTSVMLNWEMEFKKWAPAFKILTYYGSQKERKNKRIGWNKSNTFHVCITSYKLVIQDHQSFRRKKWVYFILDEAQNIKNFKSQRWQLLLNFNTDRRLLLTGTPLQNNLMELWSLMHFLMPHVFSSHKEFREWFSNPVTGMVEGSSEYNDTIIKRLHKVLRPFILRRLKSEVEKQLPKKTEHIIVCRLSKRQRFLYEDFMSRTKTKDTLAAGSFLSVINILMQLRKVCNHPNLFESRPVLSPFRMDGLSYPIPSLVWNVKEEVKELELHHPLLHLTRADLEFGASTAERLRSLAPASREIVIVDDEMTSSASQPEFVTSKIYLFGSREITNSYRLPHYIFHQILSDEITPCIPKLTHPLINYWTNTDPTTLSIRDDYMDPVNRSEGGEGAPEYEVMEFETSEDGGDFAAVMNIQIQKQSGSEPKDDLNFISIDVDNEDEEVVVVGIKEKGTENKMEVEERKGEVEERRGVKRDGRLIQNGEKGPPGSKRMRLDDYQRAQEWLKLREFEPIEFEETSIKSRKIYDRKAVLEKIQAINAARCSIFPLFGTESISRLNIFDGERLWKNYSTQGMSLKRNYARNGYFKQSYYEIIRGLKSSQFPSAFVSTTQALIGLLWSTWKLRSIVQSSLKHFTLFVPHASAPLPHRRVFQPCPSSEARLGSFEKGLVETLKDPLYILHPIISSMMTQFPDPRLIQYDCGKLQSLDTLLKTLKAGSHRVLIFTQMAKMLDVLEAFLNYHGHIYLRLDGATKIEQRQLLMERFNTDPRIFCFILSTRSGGIGVNLTGADTVIFYDSDWNPTMDAQAQDRCHRIGQTRDVHIYRLISEKTIEENILKKSNQKRLLGELAIEGGNFTTAFFKKDTIHELFEVNTAENDPIKRMAALLRESEAEEVKESTLPSTSRVQSGPESAPGSTKLLERALAQAEDETDARAALNVCAEAQAELVEFDESVPFEELGDGQDDAMDRDLGEFELEQIMEEMTGIERYAVRLMESTMEDWSQENLAHVQKEIENQKRDWEVDQLEKLEEERRQVEEEEDPDLDLHFDAGDSLNQLNFRKNRAKFRGEGGFLFGSNGQVWIDSESKECMPLWAPPTPPLDDSDVYVDVAHSFLYSTALIPKSRLPPVYTKKEGKSLSTPLVYKMEEAPSSRDTHDLSDLMISSPMKVKFAKPKGGGGNHGPRVPRPIFDRSSSEQLQLRKDYRNAKLLGRPLSVVRPTTKRSHFPGQSTEGYWLYSEDNDLLSTVQIYLELPPSLFVVNLAQTANWDLASEIVNIRSRRFHSPKSCRARYESVIGPREEGLMIDLPPPPPPKKSKKAKSSHKKASPHKKTVELHAEDNNSQIHSLFASKFDVIKSLSQKRIANAGQPMILNPNFQRTKQSELLMEHGINYERPISATEIANPRHSVYLEEMKRYIAARRAEESQGQGPPVFPLLPLKDESPTPSVEGGYTLMLDLTSEPTSMSQEATPISSVASDVPPPTLSPQAQVSVAQPLPTQMTSPTPAGSMSQCQLVKQQGIITGKTMAKPMANTGTPIQTYSGAHSTQGHFLIPRAPGTHVKRTRPRVQLSQLRTCGPIQHHVSKPLRPSTAPTQAPTPKLTSESTSVSQGTTPISSVAVPPPPQAQVSVAQPLPTHVTSPTPVVPVSQCQEEITGMTISKTMGSTPKTYSGHSAQGHFLIPRAPGARTPVQRTTLPMLQLSQGTLRPFQYRVIRSLRVERPSTTLPIQAPRLQLVGTSIGTVHHVPSSSSSTSTSGTSSNQGVPIQYQFGWTR